MSFLPNLYIAMRVSVKQKLRTNEGRQIPTGSCQGCLAFSASHTLTIFHNCRYSHHSHPFTTFATGRWPEAVGISLERTFRMASCILNQLNQVKHRDSMEFHGIPMDSLVRETAMNKTSTPIPTRALPQTQTPPTTAKCCRHHPHQQQQQPPPDAYSYSLITFTYTNTNTNNYQ